MTPPLPKLIAFDLDGTLWWPEMYMLDGAPFRKDGSGKVFDRSSEQVELMGSSAAILKELATDPKWKDTEVAYVSRTEYPKWAGACLRLFQIAPGVTMDDVGAYKEIYPGTKTRHFRAIAAESGVDFEDMIFFDNETWNCRDCSPLGITCVYTPDGMTPEMWKKGLSEFAAAKLKTTARAK